MREGTDMSGSSQTSQLLRLDTPQGGIAYDVAGDGPLVLCVPGMGELRSSYRKIVPRLLEAGYRVVLMDLRGHGDSDATFSAYGDEATAADMVALITRLGGPALIVGNSMAAGSAVLVAATRPELVSGLVLIGGYVRDPRVSPVMRAVMRIAMAPLWAAATWKAFLPKLYAGAKPDDFADYLGKVVAALKRPGYARALSLTTRTRHKAAEEALPKVTAPALVLMGELDPDFPDPQAEATWTGTALSAEVVMVADSGHYPQSQQPTVVGDTIARFADRVTHRA